MPDDEVKVKERRLKQNEYAGMVLAIATPIPLGLLFAFYLNYEGSAWGKRLVGISLLSGIVWLLVILYL
jgi:RsiW-degrading membrane proteinase PrsW (M82 family)